MDWRATIISDFREFGRRTGIDIGPTQKTDLRAEEDWDVTARDFVALAAGLGA